MYCWSGHIANRPKTASRIATLGIFLLLSLGSFVSAANLSLGIEGIPPGSARIAITNHAGVNAYITSATDFSNLPAGAYSLAAGPVQVGTNVFITPSGTTSIRLAAGETAEHIVKYFEVTDATLYRRQPDFQYCDPGQLSTVGLRRAADEVNFFRALLGLPILGVIEELSENLQLAAMLYGMNPHMETPHNPPIEALCWTPEGANTSGVANLSLVRSTSASVFRSSPPEEHVRRWLIDQDVLNLGHRRWLLDPFLPGIAFGYTQGATVAAKFSDDQHPFVVGASMQITDLGLNPAARMMTQPFIAYPYGDFPAESVPTEWPYFSFSVLNDTESYEGNAGVDYSSAHITITDRFGSKVPITAVSASTNRFGLPNHLQWQVQNLEPHHTYTVSITNIWLKNRRLSFEYSVTLK